MQVAHAAPLAAADDDGLALQLGIVPLLNCRIKGIAIHVGDGQIVQFGVGDEPSRPARRT